MSDEWVVGAAMGVGKARDIALDRKNAHLMLLVGRDTSFTLFEYIVC